MGNVGIVETNTRKKSNLSSFIGIVKTINLRFNQALLLLAAVCLLTIMLFVVLNALIRIVYIPFPGTVELVSWLAALSTAFALGNTQVHKSHVYIDLLLNSFSPTWKRIVHAIVLCISCIFFIILAWQLIKYGISLKNNGVLSETLRMSFYPLVIFVAVGFVGLPISFAMFIVGTAGLMYLLPQDAVFNLLTANVWKEFSSYSLSVIPLYILMGEIVFRSGISKNIFDTAYKWVGHYKGGMAATTILASAGFASIADPIRPQRQRWQRWRCLN